ncbi:Glycogen synthase [Sodalis glossinidius str. 'morsitans']|uniref:Glycogen synthase n=1 Tax=Sodalis glossinidius (strain morsitans) TaxID=343509 RepID=Q2NTY0_SODGM|nr:glycosyltransferase family 1 protein [Sodalis glossinidius]BAE74395.1 mannosyltransferase B [Sodalis glossinidius str. 'morsitans']CRL45017.1 Glycogen synthase [Sodalis glossinidius str. 'morsitans']
MKIVFATDAIKYPLTGIGRYALELINQLQQAPEITQLRYFRGLHIGDRLPEYHVQPSASGALPGWLKRRALLIEAFRAIYPRLQKRALRPYKDFLYHSPNYYLPAGLPRAITTFHDISVFTTPEFHPSGRVRYLAQEMEASLTRASRIITVSEFSKRELVRYFNYPAAKIDVTCLACSEVFYPRAAASAVAPLMQRLELSAEGYSLFTGTIEPRKNLTVLLDAYEQLPQALRQRYPLVLSGYKGWGSGAEHQRFERGSREGWVKYLGYVAQEELPILFAAARLFVFPSLYEGFGLPVLEAMASGVPVVCSNAASLPEVAGDAAFICEPQDVDALSAGIARGLQDEAWRTQARVAGLANAQKFSWQRCAQDTIKAYFKV